MYLYIVFFKTVLTHWTFRESIKKQFYFWRITLIKSLWSMNAFDCVLYIYMYEINILTETHDGIPWRHKIESRIFLLLNLENESWDTGIGNQKNNGKKLIHDRMYQFMLKITINCYNSGSNCSKLDNAQSTGQIDRYIKWLNSNQPIYFARFTRRKKLKTIK